MLRKWTLKMRIYIVMDREENLEYAEDPELRSKVR